jgi:hypothetical protein
MSFVSPEVWEQLEASRPTGDELIGRVAASEMTTRLLVAIDARGRRHLLVGLEAADEPLRDASSRGLTVLTQNLSLGGHGVGRYIDITCEEALGHPMLDLIAADIAPRLREADVVPRESVARVIGKWRRFWGQLPRQLLSQEAQTGLFAELWFLSYWLIPSTGIQRAVHMWRGPHGSRHDFERPGLSIEAKGTTTTRGRIHKVNGLQQLQVPEGGRLLFFSLRVREEAGANNTLPILCRACREVISKDPDAEGMFDTALIAAGYLSTHEEEYSKTRIRVIEELLFDTGGNFPKVTASTFSSGPPAGVEEIDYVINLGTFDDLIIARNPGEATGLLL